MKHTLITLTALLLAPLPELRVGRHVPEIPRFGKLRVGSFQSLEKHGAMASNVWK